MPAMIVKHTLPLLLLLALILAACTPGSTPEPPPATYLSQEHGFSIDYPHGWQVRELPDETYLSEVEQVWFAAADFPPPQTGARPEIVLILTAEDPRPGWRSESFTDYRDERRVINGIEALLVAGTNIESGLEEQALIADVREGLFLLVLPNGSPLSLEVFHEMAASLSR
jgi:hypothetical protein